MSKKLLISLTVIIIVGFGYLYLSNNKFVSEDKKIEIAQQNRIKELIPAFVPGGWNKYVGYEYNWDWRAKEDIRIAFAYPSNWILDEERDANNRITQIIIYGDGYQIKIKRGGGRGMGRPYDYTEMIGGYNARIWKSDIDGRYVFNIGVIETEYTIYTTIPGKVTDTLDQFLSTITFSK